MPHGNHSASSMVSMWFMVAQLLGILPLVDFSEGMKVILMMIIFYLTIVFEIFNHLAFSIFLMYRCF